MDRVPAPVFPESFKSSPLMSPGNWTPASEALRDRGATRRAALGRGVASTSIDGT